VETALAVASSSERERAHDLARNGRVVALIMEYLRITKTWHPLDMAGTTTDSDGLLWEDTVVPINAIMTAWVTFN
jgi:hypothetical protein